MDRICLRNMVFYTYHGVFAAEKELGQRLEVDVELHLDLGKPGQEDDLDSTVNYAEIYARTRDVVENRRFNLIEGIAAAVAREMLGSFQPSQVVVRVRKPHPPLGGLVDCAEVEVVRRPGDLAAQG